MDSGFGENPPAATFVNAWQTASNSGIPATISATTSAAVSPV